MNARQPSPSDAPHIPVLLTNMLDAMQPANGEHYIDATFGAGGYTRALLSAASCRITAFDRDPSVAAHVSDISQTFPERFTFHQQRFSAMRDHMDDGSVDGIVMDIGVSSMQIDEAERGFSFRYDAPLDMRMSGDGTSAADIVNHSDEKTLADIFWRYGEERASRAIARAIVAERSTAPVNTTFRLRDIIHRIIPAHSRTTDPATKSFQALRIAVNEELQELKAALDASLHLLREGGRLVVVSFHSLEDRIVKQFMRTHSRLAGGSSRHLPAAAISDEPPALLTLPHRKSISGSDEEIRRNPRARSAKLRVAVRTATPVTDEASHA